MVSLIQVITWSELYKFTSCPPGSISSTLLTQVLGWTKAVCKDFRRVIPKGKGKAKHTTYMISFPNLSWGNLPGLQLQSLLLSTRRWWCRILWLLHLQGGKRVNLATWQGTGTIEGNWYLLIWEEEEWVIHKVWSLVSNSSFCPQMLRWDDFALHFQPGSFLLFPFVLAEIHEFIPFIWYLYSIP